MGKKKTEASTEDKALAATGTADTALQPWEEDMAARAAKAAAKVEGLTGGSFASIKQGVLKVGGNAIPGGELVCIILAHTNVKNYFTSEEFDPDEKVSPVCYSFSDDPKNFTPSEAAPEKQCDNCQDCPHNLFGTSTKGKKKGKRCKDQIRLAFIPGGVINKDGSFAPETDVKTLAGSEVVSLNIPATSLKSMGLYTKTLSLKNRPPFAVYTHLKVEPDDATMVKVSFTDYGNISGELYSGLAKRADDAEKNLVQPYPKNEVKAKAPATKKKPNKKLS